MKKRLIAIFIMVAILSLTFSIAALAEDNYGLTPVKTEYVYVEGTNCWQSEYCPPEGDVLYWNCYDICSYVLFETINGDTIVIGQDFEYDGNIYHLTCDNPQNYDNRWVAGNEYQVTINVCQWKDEEEVIVEDDLFTLTYKIVKKPEVSINLPSEVNLYEGKDTYTTCDWLYYDEEKGQDVFSDEYVAFETWASIPIEYNGDVYDSNYLEYLGTTYSINIAFENIQSYENQWSVGETHTAEVFFMGDSYGTITFKICADPIESIEIGDITFYYSIDNNCYTYDCDPETGEQISPIYSSYYVLSKEIPLTVNFSDGSEPLNTTILGGQIQDEVTIAGEPYPDLVVYCIDDGQSYENQWDHTGNYQVTFNLLGRTITKEVTVAPPPIESITFEDIVLYEDTFGEYDKDTGNFIYYLYPIISDAIFSDEGSMYYSSTIEIGNAILHPVISYNQYEKPLKAGDNLKIDVNICTSNGVSVYTSSVNVEIKETPVIDDIQLEARDVTVAEGEDGYFDVGKGIFVYNLMSVADFVVTYPDGSVGYSSAYPEVAGYYEKSIDDYFTFSVFEEKDDEQTSDNPWLAGETHKVTLYFAGQQCDFNVTIVENDVESIEIESLPTIYSNQPSIFSDNAPIYIKVNYKNGESETLSLSDLSMLGCSVSYTYDEEFQPTAIRIDYKGKSDTENLSFVSVDEFPVTKVAVESSDKLIAYYANGEYYFNPTDYYVDVWFKGESEPQRVLVEGDKWNYPVEYKGETFFLQELISFPGYDSNNQTYIMGISGFAPFDGQNDANIEFVPANVNVENVTAESLELVKLPSRTYYKNDALFSDCMWDSFSPFDFRGMELKLNLSNGDSIMLYGDDTYEFNRNDRFSTRGVSNGIEFNINPKADGYTSHLSVLVLGKEFDLCDIEAVDSNIVSMEVLNNDEMMDDIKKQNGDGLKFKVTYSDGKTETITLDKAEKWWMEVSAIGKGDGLIDPVDNYAISGIRYNWYKVGNEFASIIWNNNLLRYKDTILFLDTGKVMNVNSDVTEVEVKDFNINNNIINQLTAEERYKVEQQGMDINTEMSIEKTDASKDILKLAAGDDVTINSAYEIDIAYKLDGNTTQITELGDGKILITIKLPDDMLGKDKYVVYREHKNADGTVSVEEIEATLSDDGKYISFESSKFSTFALGYAEDKTPGGGNNGGKLTPGNKPNGGNGNSGNMSEKIANTLDNSPIGGTIALMMSSGLCAYAVIKKRREIA